MNSDLDREIDRLMATPVEAPPGFTDRLMSRIGEARPAVRAALPADPIPWWLRAVLDPAAVLSFVLIAALAWGGSALWTSVASAAWLGDLVARWVGDFFARPGLDFLARPAAWLGLELLVFCLTLVALRPVRRAMARAARRAFPPTGGGPLTAL